MVNFKELYDGSAYTISGAGGDLKEWKDGYQDLFNKEKIGKIKKWYEFTGREMNNEFGLTGKNAYPSNLQFLAFPLEGLDVGKLAIFKLKMGDRWFDDIVNNIRGNGVEEDEETYRGYKTAVYGRKGHRDSITQLENSVRKMF